MALVLHTDGTRELRSEAEAEKLWLIKVGRARPQTPRQRAQVRYLRKTIRRVRLNYKTAPEAYVLANLDEIIPQAIANWIVDRRGRPVRPATKEDMIFAVKYGLWYNGQPTYLVNGTRQLGLAV
jgi:hypothetical protein